MIRLITSTFSLPIYSKILFHFSQPPTQPPTQSPTQQFNPTFKYDVNAHKGEATYFYQKSMKRLTQNNRAFTQHLLIRITKLAKTHNDAILLFQAYYNYLGRHVIMENKTVDDMNKKALSIIKSKEQSNIENTEELSNVVINRIIQLYSKHEYLSYFPHYTTTQALIQSTISNHDTFNIVLTVLLEKMLIKFDQNCYLAIIINLSKLPTNLAKKSLKLIFQKLLHTQTITPQHLQLFCSAVEQYSKNQQGGLISYSSNCNSLLQQYSNHIQMEGIKSQRIISSVSTGYLLLLKIDKCVEILGLAQKWGDETLSLWRIIGRLIAKDSIKKKIDILLENINLIKKQQSPAVTEIREGK